MAAMSHAEPIVCQVEKPDRLFERALHCHHDIILLASGERHRDAVAIGAELDMRRVRGCEAPAGKQRLLYQQAMLPIARRPQPIGGDLASEPGQPHHPLRDDRFDDRMLLLAAAINGDLLLTA
jgi:hypothetical protein